MSVAMLKEELKNLVFFFISCQSVRLYSRPHHERLSRVDGKRNKEKENDKILTTKATSANISLPSSPVPKNVIRAYT